MKNLRLIALMFSVVLTIACKDTKKETVVETEVEEIIKDDVKEKRLSITLLPKSGSNVEGTINFSEKNGLVTMVGTVTG